MAEHAGHAHTHVVAPTADRRRVVFALCLILGFMLLEVALGVVANSLALLSDAGHMLTDALALAMSLMVMRLAVRQPGARSPTACAGRRSSPGSPTASRCW